MKLKDLAAEFPREAIHWRAQTLTKNGDKALALPYLDARDVMDRLDAVCGPENWQSRYVETARGRVLCDIGIRIGDEWVWKSDGAGNTAVEGEKGGISDALKRAAVQWGIGRYLYRLDAVWAPCKTYEKNGKLHFDDWTSSPWNSVRSGKATPQLPAQPDTPKRDPDEIRDKLVDVVKAATSADDLNTKLGGAKFDAAWQWLSDNHKEHSRAVQNAVGAKREQFEPDAYEATHGAQDDLDGDEVPF